MAPPAPTPGNEKPEGPDLNTAAAVPPTVLGPEGTTPEEKDSMPTQHGLMKLVQNMEQLIPLWEKYATDQEKTTKAVETLGGAVSAMAGATKHCLGCINLQYQGESANTKALQDIRWQLSGHGKAQNTSIKAIAVDLQNALTSAMAQLTDMQEDHHGKHQKTVDELYRLHSESCKAQHERMKELVALFSEQKALLHQLVENTRIMAGGQTIQSSTPPPPPDLSIPPPPPPGLPEHAMGGTTPKQPPQTPQNDSSFYHPKRPRITTYGGPHHPASSYQTCTINAEEVVFSPTRYSEKDAEEAHPSVAAEYSLGYVRHGSVLYRRVPSHFKTPTA